MVQHQHGHGRHRRATSQPEDRQLPSFGRSGTARRPPPAARRTKPKAMVEQNAPRLPAAETSARAAPRSAAGTRLEAGTLVPIHPRRFAHRNGWSHWFVTRPEVAQRAAVRRLRYWLTEAVAGRK